MGAGTGGRLTSKHLARGSANKSGEKEAGLSIRCSSSLERTFGGMLRAFGDTAAKAV